MLVKIRTAYALLLLLVVGGRIVKGYQEANSQDWNKHPLQTSHYLLSGNWQGSEALGMVLMIAPYYLLALCRTLVEQIICYAAKVLKVICNAIYYAITCVIREITDVVKECDSISGFVALLLEYWIVLSFYQYIERKDPCYSSHPWGHIYLLLVFAIFHWFTMAMVAWHLAKFVHKLICLAYSFKVTTASSPSPTKTKFSRKRRLVSRTPSVKAIPSISTSPVKKVNPTIKSASSVQRASPTARNKIPVKKANTNIKTVPEKNTTPAKRISLVTNSALFEDSSVPVKKHSTKPSSGYEESPAKGKTSLNIKMFPGITMAPEVSDAPAECVYPLLKEATVNNIPPNEAVATELNTFPEDDKLTSRNKNSAAPHVRFADVDTVHMINSNQPIDQQAPSGPEIQLGDRNAKKVSSAEKEEQYDQNHDEWNINACNNYVHCDTDEIARLLMDEVGVLGDIYRIRLSTGRILVFHPKIDNTGCISWDGCKMYSPVIDHEHRLMFGYMSLSDAMKESVHSDIIYRKKNGKDIWMDATEDGALAYVRDVFEGKK